MKTGLTYLLVVIPWIAFTAFAMVEFSPKWGWLLIIPAGISIKN